MRAWLMGLCLLACGGARQPEPSPPALVIASASPADKTAKEPDAPAIRAPAAPPKLALERLPRTIRTSRARALLVTELEALEKLLEATPDTSRDRPLLLRRLAGDYFELYLVLLAEAGDTKPALVRADESFAQARPSLDSAPNELYVLGLVQEQLGNLAGAREIFGAVLKNPTAPTDVAARAHYGLALIAELHGALDEAKSEYARARETLFMLGYERTEDRELRRVIDEKLQAATPRR